LKKLIFDKVDEYFNAEKQEVDEYFNSEKQEKIQVIGDILRTLVNERRRSLEIREPSESLSWRHPSDDEKRWRVATAFIATKRIRKLQDRMGQVSKLGTDVFEEVFGGKLYEDRRSDTDPAYIRDHEVHLSQEIQPPRKKQKRQGVSDVRLKTAPARDAEKGNRVATVVPSTTFKSLGRVSIKPIEVEDRTATSSNNTNQLFDGVNNGRNRSTQLVDVEERQKAAAPIQVINQASGGKNSKISGLAAGILRGVTITAALAREKLKSKCQRASAKGGTMSPNRTEAAVDAARKAAFEGVNERDPREQIKVYAGNKTVAVGCPEGSNSEEFEAFYNHTDESFFNYGNGNRSEMFEVRIPKGVLPGDPFDVMVGGRMDRLSCPLTARGGQKIRIKLDVPLSSAPYKKRKRDSFDAKMNAANALPVSTTPDLARAATNADQDVASALPRSTTNDRNEVLPPVCHKFSAIIEDEDGESKVSHAEPVKWTGCNSNFDHEDSVEDVDELLRLAE